MHRPHWYILLLSLSAVSASAQTLRFFEFGFRTPLPDSMNVYAAATKSSLIDQALAQLALPEEQRNLFINGDIQYGTQTNNPLYTWHFVTDAWELTELAIELCDGRPDDVENDKQYWIETVGSFCPWSSYVKREIFPLDVGDSRAQHIRLYPNPAMDVLHIEPAWANPIWDIQLLDALGSLIDVNWSAGVVDLSPLPPGVYYVVIRSKPDILIYKISKR